MMKSRGGGGGSGGIPSASGQMTFGHLTLRGPYIRSTDNYSVYTP